MLCCNGSGRDGCKIMRVMTFNIQHGLNQKSNIIELEAVSKIVEKYGADVCGLNEVRGDGALKNYTDQTEAIGVRLGFYRYFGEAFRVDGVNPYGNAIVSRYALKLVQTVPVPEPEDRNILDGYEPRCVIKAVADVGGTDVCFLVCHMGLNGSEQRSAVDTLCRLVDESRMPIIVMGDFNTKPDSDILMPLYDRLSDTSEAADNPDIYTFPSYAPCVKLDYMLYKGLSCSGARVIEEVVSDHFPIIADFDFPREK